MGPVAFDNLPAELRVKIMRLYYQDSIYTVRVTALYDDSAYLNPEKSSASHPLALLLTNSHIKREAFPLLCEGSVFAFEGVSALERFTEMTPPDLVTNITRVQFDQTSYTSDIRLQWSFIATALRKLPRIKYLKVNLDGPFYAFPRTIEKLMGTVYDQVSDKRLKDGSKLQMHVVVPHRYHRRYHKLSIQESKDGMLKVEYLYGHHCINKKMCLSSAGNQGPVIMK
ncbi:hypothetical protein CAC42_832 [Sphaceloma murrayae]|uniref:Uncharacterized protein n=1 Tax=Sphaceloma murrayae TaxID=2082308 RepID=A0A2K1QL78_9PEZI|nr:hypothetical protein CAC42_832 [Sphaceloma murrayae]